MTFWNEEGKQNVTDLVLFSATCKEYPMVDDVTIIGLLLIIYDCGLIYSGMFRETNLLKNKQGIYELFKCA